MKSICWCGQAMALDRQYLVDLVAWSSFASAPLRLVCVSGHTTWLPCGQHEVFEGIHEDKDNKQDIGLENPVSQGA